MLTFVELSLGAVSAVLAGALIREDALPRALAAYVQQRCVQCRHTRTSPPAA